MALQLTLLGGVELRTAAGERVPLPKKVAALLAYLAMHQGRPQSREALTALLWEDSAAPQARASLRYALTVLRRCIAPPGGRVLRSDREKVWLDECELSADAVRLEQLVATGSPEALAEAVTLYCGDFLHGMSIASEAFEDWLRGERERLRALVETALDKLLSHHEATGEIDRAIDSALRLLTIDPLREDAHRRLIALFLRQQRRADALRQYERFRDLLRRELGVEPDIETRRLIEPLLPQAGRRPDDAVVRRVMATSSALREPTIFPQFEMRMIAVSPLRLLHPTAEATVAAMIIREGLEFSLSRFRELRVVRHVEGRGFASTASDFVIAGEVLHDADDLTAHIRLVDAPTGLVLWERKFRMSGCTDEGTIGEIVASICAVIEIHQIERLHATPSIVSRSFPLALLARAEANRISRSSLERAVHLARRAHRLDPDNALALSMLALASVFQIRMGWSQRKLDALAQARDAADEALRLDDADAVALGVLGLVHLWSGAHDLALSTIQHGLELNPNSADLLHWKALAHHFCGEQDAAIPLNRAALRLAPQHRVAFAAANALAGSYYQLGAYDEAVAWAGRSIALNPSYRRSYVALAASAAQLGDEHVCARALAKAKDLDASFSLRTQLAGFIYRNTREVAAWESGFRRAGLHD